jgi:hypothetical protein
MTASFQASLGRAAVAMALALSSRGVAFAEIPNRTIKRFVRTTAARGEDCSAIAYHRMLPKEVSR